MSVYNGERYLREAVESILGQSFRDFEFIVINDGSTDRSGALLDSYEKQDPRVRLYHQENRGLIESLNRGCGLARGKYIARMDADDVAVRDRFVKQVEFMEGHSEVAVVGGAVTVINAKGDYLATYRNPVEDHEIKAELLQGGCPLWHPAILMRTRIFLSVGGYRKVVIDAEDLDLWLRMADRYEFANLEDVILKYRRHSFQVSVRKFKRQALSNLAARTATLLRRSRNSDPLESVAEITPRVLGELGLSEARQHAAIAKAYLICIHSMYEAREYSIAGKFISEVLPSPVLEHAESYVIADLYLCAAQLALREKRFVESVRAVAQAIIARPIILGRPLKLWLISLRRSLKHHLVHNRKLLRDGARKI